MQNRKRADGCGWKRRSFNRKQTQAATNVDWGTFWSRRPPTVDDCRNQNRKSGVGQSTMVGVHDAMRLACAVLALHARWPLSATLTLECLTTLCSHSSISQVPFSTQNLEAFQTQWDDLVTARRLPTKKSILCSLRSQTKPFRRTAPDHRGMGGIKEVLGDLGTTLYESTSQQTMGWSFSSWLDRHGKTKKVC